MTSGSLTGTASLASNSLLLQGTGSIGFATTASMLEVSSSQQQISSSLLQVSASYISLSGSYTTFSGSASTRITVDSASLLQLSASYISLSGSYNTFSGSASTRVTQIENVYATTGSNSFRANQSITGSLVVSSTITAQTLVVQTVTSSIVYSSGSNIFGSLPSDRQTFTGSVYVSGSGNFGNGVVANNTFINQIGLTVNGNTTGGVRQNFIAQGSSGTYNFQIGTTITANNAFEIIPSTAIDGTTFSTAVFRILNTGAIQINTNNVALTQKNAAGTGTIGLLRVGSDDKIQIGDGGTANPSVIYFPNGNIGIGTTNPAQSLEVNGSILASSTGKIGFRYSSTDGSYYSYLISATAGSIGPIVLAGGVESGGASNEAIRFVTNANPGERSAVSILNSGKVGIGTTGPTTQFQIRKNYWQFWDEKAHGSNVNMFSITFPDFGSAVITIAGSRYSPGADNYSGTSIFYIYITNVGAVSVNGGNTSGTWTPTTSVASKTVTFASAYAGSSTNYTGYSAVIQASGHSGGSESAAYITIL